MSMSSISEDVLFQGRLFLQALCWGGGLIFAYDCLRLVRMFLTRGKAVQAIEEILFWLTASCVIYSLIYRYNSGAVRNYVVFGMAVGMLIYRILLSSIVIRAVSFIMRPLRNGMRIFKTFVKHAGKRLKSAFRRVKIKIKYIVCRKIKRQGEQNGRGQKKGP